MPRVLNKHSDIIPLDSAYVGRPSKWGNPFVMANAAARDRVCDDYEKWFMEPGQKKLRDSLHELRGKDLVCWCAPQRCHADFLLKVANG